MNAGEWRRDRLCRIHGNLLNILDYIHRHVTCNCNVDTLYLYSHSECRSCW